MNDTLVNVSHDVWLDAEGIVHSVALAHHALTLAEAEEVRAQIARLGPLKARPVLVNFGQLLAVTPEARRFFALPETASYTSALAFVVRSPLSRAIGNFFLGLNKIACPTRLFESEEQAMRWLREFL